jgi:hypothetical protein
MRTLSMLAALTVLPLISCSSENVATASNVTARWSCGKNTGGPTNQTALTGVSWSGEKLIVKVVDNDYCGGSRISDMNYKATGSKLELRWAWRVEPGAAITACACDHAISFELSNLPRQEYQVDLIRKR